jgi:hypothetical protein
LFFSLAFAAGRDLGAMIPGIGSVALFFTASAVGLLVTAPASLWRSSPVRSRSASRLVRCCRWSQSHSTPASPARRVQPLPFVARNIA